MLSLSLEHVSKFEKSLLSMCDFGSYNENDLSAQPKSKKIVVPGLKKNGINIVSKSTLLWTIKSHCNVKFSF